jgi:hypothetical protein
MELDVYAARKSKEEEVQLIHVTLLFLLFQKLALSPHSTTFESWKESKFPVFMDIYLFNCTNPHQMTEEDFKPDLVQLGPYRFL